MARVMVMVMGTDTDMDTDMDVDVDVTSRYWVLFYHASCAMWRSNPAIYNSPAPSSLHHSPPLIFFRFGI